MDKVFIVLASRYGYSKTLFGVYRSRLLAENRIAELKLTYQSLDEFGIEEIVLNAAIEMNF